MTRSALFLSLALALTPCVALAQAPAAAEAAAQDTWQFKSATGDVTRFKSFIIEPTVILRDKEATTWGKATDAEKQKYADLFTEALRNEIPKSYPLATAKGPGVGVMRITLLGVAPTSALAVATKVTPIGFAINGVKGMAGKKGSFSGSVNVALELSDSESGELVYGVMRRRSPNAIDISAATTTENTVAAVAKDSASAIRAALDKANGR